MYRVVLKIVPTKAMNMKNKHFILNKEDRDFSILEVPFLKLALHETSHFTPNILDLLITLFFTIFF